MQATNNVIGVGLLDWPRKERITGRYGTIALYAPDHENKPIDLPSAYDGRHGVLIARIAGESIRPTTRTHAVELGIASEEELPRLGTDYLLGQGTLFREALDPAEVGEGKYAIGLHPDDGCQSDEEQELYNAPWLNDDYLHCLHQQIVELSFVEGEKHDQ